MKQVKKTEGSEYYTLEGIEYKGYYYINTKNNIAYVYDELNKATKILVPKHTHDTETIRLRSKLKGGTSTPVLIKPQISDYTYAIGKIQRYFVQKRNSPENTIVEIDSTQYTKLNSEYSSDALDRNIYKGVSFEWLISGNDEYVKMKNQRTLDDTEKNFKGINRYLKNPLEFYKK